MNNMLIAQSGGPTAAINASLSGAIQEAIRSKEIDGVYGALNGIQGVLAGTIIDLRSQFSRQEDFSILRVYARHGVGFLPVPSAGRGRGPGAISKNRRDF